MSPGQSDPLTFLGLEAAAPLFEFLSQVPIHCVRNLLPTLLGPSIPVLSALPPTCGLALVPFYIPSAQLV